MGEVPSAIGPYRIVRTIGEGGMGKVYEAVHEAIERRVAIKVLHRELASNAELTARFFNEARAVNRIEHAGLVQISDYGQQPDGAAYIVMEYLKGEPLAKRIERSGGKLSAAEVISLNLQIADALAAAHAKDVIHRDLKPENVMVLPDPHMPGGERTKLLDFGIAKIREQGDQPRVQTKTAQLMGTPYYMSPEQCEGAGRVDAKSDVYSLGIMMFEMLAGKLPFDADGPGKILGMHMFAPPPLLKEVAPEVPEELAALVQRLLVKEREQRPSMSDVVAELTALADQHPLARPADQSRHAMPPLVDPLAPTLMEGNEPDGKKSTLGAFASQAAAPTPRRSRRRGAFILGAALLVALGAGLLLRKGLPIGASPLSRLRQKAPVVAQGTAPVPATPPLVPQGSPPVAAPKPAAAPVAEPAVPPAAGPAAPPVTEPAPPVSPTTSVPKQADSPKPGPSKPKPAAPPKSSASKPKLVKVVTYKRVGHTIYRYTTYKLVRNKK
jgi:serine/threonine-protein kinase